MVDHYGAMGDDGEISRMTQASGDIEGRSRE
jgi:hypothetical protein